MGGKTVPCSHDSLDIGNTNTKKLKSVQDLCSRTIPFACKLASIFFSRLETGSLCLQAFEKDKAFVKTFFQKLLKIALQFKPDYHVTFRLRSQGIKKREKETEDEYQERKEAHEELQERRTLTRTHVENELNNILQILRDGGIHRFVPKPKPKPEPELEPEPEHAPIPYLSKIFDMFGNDMATASYMHVRTNLFHFARKHFINRLFFYLRSENRIPKGKKELKKVKYAIWKLSTEKCRELLNIANEDDDDDDDDEEETKAKKAKKDNVGVEQQALLHDIEKKAKEISTEHVQKIPNSEDVKYFKQEDYMQFIPYMRYLLAYAEGTQLSEDAVLELEGIKERFKKQLENVKGGKRARKKLWRARKRAFDAFWKDKENPLTLFSLVPQFQFKSRFIPVNRTIAEKFFGDDHRICDVLVKRNIKSFKTDLISARLFQMTKCKSENCFEVTEKKFCKRCQSKRSEAKKKKKEAEKKKKEAEKKKKEAEKKKGKATKKRKQKKKKTPKETIPRKTPKDLLDIPMELRSCEDTHGKDLRLVPDDNTVFGFVDPGHANIISIVFYCGGRKLKAPLRSTSKRGKRQASLDEHCVENGQVQFNLTNGEYGHMTFRFRTNRAAKKASSAFARVNEKLSVKHGKTADVDRLVAHVKLLADSSEVIMHEKSKMIYRVDDFARFRARKRAYLKIYKKMRASIMKFSLTNGAQKLKLVLVWGNGSFGPTSKGHASAPNKGLRIGLVRYVPIVLCSEYNTSKRCPKCGSDVHQGRNPRTGSKIRGVLYCNNKSCGFVMSRDASACMGIHAIWKHKCDHEGLPEAYKRRK